MDMLQPVKLPSDRNGLFERATKQGSQAVAYFELVTNTFGILQGPDLADIAHFLCILHGRHPGVVDHAATKTVEERARDWIVCAMNGFAAERAFLTKLTVAAGPITGVGQYDQSEATVHSQRKALEMLSQSDRYGCAIGASIAVVVDWHAIRIVLNSIAVKLGIEPQVISLPSITETQELYNIFTSSPSMERATNFGVDQILSQHRGLWELLAARRMTRNSNSE